MDGQGQDLAEVVADLAARVRALEAAQAGSLTATPQAPAPAPGPPPAGDDAGRWWLLDRLARHTGPAFARDDAAGSIAFGGRVRAPGTGEVVWQLEHPLPAVLDADLGAASAVLGALGHPVRLEILRRLLLGAHTLGELQEIPGTGTSGQIHHHLRELRAAGLIVQQRRNHYAIPAERVVPWLVIVAAALGRG